MVHPMAVVRNLQRAGVRDERILAASFLHDTIEDTDATYDEIAAEFGPDVARMVMDVTSDTKELKRLGKTEYLTRKMLSLSNDSLTIKLGDRLNNISDLDRMAPVKSKSYASQTRAILDALYKGRTFTPEQKNLIDAIEITLRKFEAK